MSNQPNLFTVEVDVIGELLSKRERNFRLQDALLELIDNSIDEGATKITIREEECNLIIEDNGSGFDDIKSALIVAKSNKQGKIGRYGVGMKDACLKYSNTTIIQSKGKQVVVPWLKMIQSQNPTLVEETDIDYCNTTQITLCKFRPRYRNAIETKEIRRTYQKLIEKGLVDVEIVGTKLTALPLPRFTEQINQEIIYDGRKLILTGGIYASNDPARPDWKGYNPYYNGRLIGNGRITSYGTGDEGCTTFCFMLELLDELIPWGLATNKDEVEGINELLDYIYHSYTRPILERGASQAVDIELKTIEDKINQSLNGIKGGNITRGPRTFRDEPNKESQQGSPKVNTFTATNDGGYITGKGRTGGRGKIKFRFTDLGGDSIGNIQDDGRSGVTIEANLNNPFIADNKNNEALVMFFAKVAYSMNSAFKGHDTTPDHFATTILTNAGKELA